MVGSGVRGEKENLTTPLSLVDHDRCTAPFTSTSLFSLEQDSNVAHPPLGFAHKSFVFEFDPASSLFPNCHNFCIHFGFFNTASFLHKSKSEKRKSQQSCTQISCPQNDFSGQKRKSMIQHQKSSMQQGSAFCKMGKLFKWHTSSSVVQQILAVWNWESQPKQPQKLLVREGHKMQNFDVTNIELLIVKAQSCSSAPAQSHDLTFV